MIRAHVPRAAASIAAIVCIAIAVPGAALEHDAPLKMTSIGPIALFEERAAVEARLGPGTLCRNTGRVVGMCYTDGLSRLRILYESGSVIWISVSERSLSTEHYARIHNGQKVASWTWNGEPVFRHVPLAKPLGWSPGSTDGKEVAYTFDGYSISKGLDVKDGGWALTLSEE